MGFPNSQIAYTAKIFFIGTNYSVFIDGYHIHHGSIDHDPDEGTRRDCWNPVNGATSYRPSNASNNHLQIYPIPTKRELNIEFNKKINTIFPYQILMGNIYYRKQITAIQG